MGGQEKQRQAYELLKEFASSRATLTPAILDTRLGWKGQTSKTYLSKHFAAYLEKITTGQYLVIPEFQRVSWDEFQELVTQVRRPFPSYKRSTISSTVVYEFLMPLTREDKLRRALDQLFYRDTLKRRLHEIGLASIEAVLPRANGDTDEKCIDRIIEFIQSRIGGFSISHVSGRFRVGDILSRDQAAKQTANDEPYLIDETTAVVRFIIPCLSSIVTHQSPAFELGPRAQSISKDVSKEISQIRKIFFELFVEAIVPTIRGEKLIWLLEASPEGNQLYALELLDANAGKGEASKELEVDDEDDTGDEEGQ